jgi:hypothetical protein
MAYHRKPCKCNSLASAFGPSPTSSSSRSHLQVYKSNKAHDNPSCHAHLQYKISRVDHVGFGFMDKSKFKTHLKEFKENCSWTVLSFMRVFFIINLENCTSFKKQDDEYLFTFFFLVNRALLDGSNTSLDLKRDIFISIPLQSLILLVILNFLWTWNIFFILEDVGFNSCNYILTLTT